MTHDEELILFYQKPDDEDNNIKDKEHKSDMINAVASLTELMGYAMLIGGAVFIFYVAFLHK